MSTEPKPITGSCLCRRVRYQLTGGLGNTVICYCNNCRKATGSAFMANSFCEKANLTITEGASYLHTYDDGISDSGNTVRRSFCTECGSPLFASNEKMFPGGAIITAGTMDQTEGEDGWTPQMELFCKRKAGWLKTEGTEKRKEMVGFYAEGDGAKDGVEG